MLRIIIAPFLILLSASLFSQTQLQVTGIASMSVSPTEAELVITLNTKRATYTNAVGDLVDRSNSINKTLNKLGFEDREIKSSKFNVSKETRYENRTQIEDGFRATQQLKVKFPMNAEKLINVLEKTTASESKPEVSVNFGLDKNTEAETMEALLKQAVDDASKKAEIIANQSGYKISGIHSINHGAAPQFPGPQSRGMMMEMSAASDARLQSFEADDLTFSDKVTIIYLIEKQ